MRHPGLIRMLENSVQYKDLERRLALKNNVAVYGLEGTQKHLTMGLIEHTLKKPLLIVSTGEDRAREISSDLSALFSPGAVEHFPAREVLPVDVYAHSREILSQRVGVLQKVIKGRIRCVVTTFEALSRRLSPPDLFQEMFLEYEVGQRLDKESLLKQLLRIGYERVEVVEIPGQFAARGGLVDVYPITGLRPYRIDFFGDEIDAIRAFDPKSQLSKENHSTVVIAPALEFTVPPHSPLWEEGKRAISEDLLSTKNILAGRKNKGAISKLDDKINTLLERMESGLVAPDLERYLSLFISAPHTLLDYFKEKPAIILDEPLQFEKAARDREKEFKDSFKNLLEEGAVLSKQGEIFLDYAALKSTWDRHQKIYFSLLPKKSGLLGDTTAVSMHARKLPEFRGKLKLLLDAIDGWKKAKYAVVIMTSSKERGGHLKESLWDNKIEAVFIPSINSELKPGQVVITYGTLNSGFELSPARIVVVTDREVFGRPKSRRLRRQFTEGIRITDISDIKPGDYVVHVHHGIGKYLGIVNLEVQGVKRDYLHIQYHGQDRLYVPTDQVDFIQKYIGAEGYAPKLHKLGGSEWARAKARVRSSVQELARELLNLYAARQTIKGHPFSPDGAWQSEFEAAFPYKETPDQLRAIEEVKADMEKPKPMDRLLVGDVGYGKTEVALRAAFKAVMDNKQVAVLAPTTVLAHQHYQTFKERFSQFPVEIRVLSRLKKPKEQKKIIEDLKNGSADIIIGTHRLLSKDIQFKDLGLLIIDEEQRFGVAHKEKLKKLRKEVDVLTLTATPIPRTLHMALAGARDMSVINTPPENRYPVQTYVVEYSRELIVDAIRRELNRKGQVFYVHNRVIDLEDRVKELQALLPEARIAMAHGQMPERRLERVMVDFVQGDIDVLVCTTIIENGLDIPNVNTLIVEEADNFGLAQLYQLRGRVGRTNRIAYAYFTYRRNKMLSEIAEKRLNAISEFTEFGSGFKLAIRDLEIRGAGNLLGPEQHGHMLAVGFDLYCRLLEEEVAKLKGKSEEREEKVTAEIELNVSAYIDGSYISEPSIKFEIYRRLRDINSEGELFELQKELEDRFGPPPKEAVNLLLLTKLRVLAQKLAIVSIKEAANEVKIKFRDEARICGDSLMILAKEYPRQLTFSSIGGLEISLGKRNIPGDKLIQCLTEILYKILELSSRKH